MFHITLHFLVPALVALAFYRQRFVKTWLILIATIAVDIDHLLADPVYDPNRCSIGFHPLHTYPAIVIYVLMLFWPRTRIVGIGLVIHMALDFIDCIW
jgi:hypothetical protein